jgi:hypothetical protein
VAGVFQTRAKTLVKTLTTKALGLTRQVTFPAAAALLGHAAPGLNSKMKKRLLRFPV